MISRTHRFHGHGSLRYVYQNGRTVRGVHTALRFVQNDRRSSYRLAVVVSKKISKSAVVRNRIRRRIYEQVRLLEPQLQVPYDLVITVYDDQLTAMPAEKLAQAIQKQLVQAKILAGSATPGHAKIRGEGE